MRPILLRIPIPGTGMELPVFGYGVFVFLGFVVALWIAGRRASRFGIAPGNLLDLGLWMLLAGVIGGRLFFIAMFWDQMHSWLDLIALWKGGLVLYGGVAGAVAAFFWYTARQKLPRRKLLDLLAPAVIAGVAVGRIGCFMNGCCWGDPTLLPWAVQFPFGSPPYMHHLRQGLVSAGLDLAPGPEGVVVTDIQPGSWAERVGLQPGDRIVSVRASGAQRSLPTPTVTAFFATLREIGSGRDVHFLVRRGRTRTTLTGRFDPRPPGSLPVHPTQLYSTLGGVIIACWLTWSQPERWRSGLGAVALMVAYGCQRFLIEILRDDLPPLALGLTIAQWISLVLIATGALLALWLWSTPPTAKQANGLSEGRPV